MFFFYIGLEVNTSNGAINDNVLNDSKRLMESGMLLKALIFLCKAPD